MMRRAPGGSNLGPLSQKLMDQVKDRVEAYRSENNLPVNAKVPADAVTASGSGLDPHISREKRRNPGATGGKGKRHGRR